MDPFVCLIYFVFFLYKKNCMFLSNFQKNFWEIRVYFTIISKVINWRKKKDIRYVRLLRSKVRGKIWEIWIHLLTKLIFVNKKQNKLNDMMI